MEFLPYDEAREMMSEADRAFDDAWRRTYRIPDGDRYAVEQWIEGYIAATDAPDWVGPTNLAVDLYWQGCIPVLSA